MSTYFPLAGSNAVIPALNPVKITEIVTNAEFPPAGANNAGAYADYTDTVVSIDAGTPMTLVEFPPVGLTSATTGAGPTTIAVSGAFYGNGNYIVTGSSVLTDGNFLPWTVFDKTLPASGPDGWVSVHPSYSGGVASSPSTTVSGVTRLGSWVQIKLPSSIILKSYQIARRPSEIVTAPASIVVAGSTDGSTWNLLDFQSGLTLNDWAIYLLKPYNINNNTLYNYYRWIFPSTVGTTYPYVSISEIKLFADIPLPTTAREYPPLPMTANTSYLNGTYGAGAYVASGSSIFSSTYPYYLAFNKTLINTSDCWVSATSTYNTSSPYAALSGGPTIASNISYTGSYIQLDLSQPFILKGYSLASAGTNPPFKWVLVGSIDNIIWNLIDTQDNKTNASWTTGTYYYYDLPLNIIFYKYYRLVVLNIGNTTGYVAIGQIKLFNDHNKYTKYRTAIPSSHTTYNAGTYTTYANTQYNATTVEAAPPLFVADKTLTAPWRTGASNYTISADASPIPSVFFELPSQIRLASYRMTAPDTSEAPSAWNVYGSNMNVVGGWLLLDARTSIVAPWATSLTQTFSLPSPTSAFNFFKVDLLRNCASTAPGDFIALSELRLIGDDVAPESRIAVGADGRVAVNAPPDAVNASAAMTVGGNLAVNGSIRADNLGMFRNRIINGDMRIDQRLAGTSSNLVATAVGAYIADRWRVSNGTTTGALTVQRVRAPANPYGQVYALSAIATTAQATMNNQDYVTLEQRIEGYNIADFGWGGAYAQPITISFAAYSTQAGQYTLALRNADNTRSYVAPFTVPVANQWVQVQQTVPGETMGTWEVETALGLSVAITLAAGSNWLTSDVGRWQESSRAPSGFGYAAATGGVNFMGTLNNQFYLTGVQVEKGTIMTPFEARPVQAELQMCQRYYEYTGYFINSPTQSDGYARAWWTFKVTKRIAPTFIRDAGAVGTLGTYVEIGINHMVIYDTVAVRFGINSAVFAEL